jgi:hypothetical protein
MFASRLTHRDIRTTRSVENEVEAVSQGVRYRDHARKAVVQYLSFTGKEMDMLGIQKGINPFLQCKSHL